MSRTSVCQITRIVGSTAAGPTARRSMRPNHSRSFVSREWAGAAASTVTPSPQPRTLRSMNVSRLTGSCAHG